MAINSIDFCILWWFVYFVDFAYLRRFSRSIERHKSLTHWGRVTHICVSELTIIGSDNGLSPGRRQAIIWNNVGLLLIEPLGKNFSKISIGIRTFSFKKTHLNMSSMKWRPFCLGLNVLMVCSVHISMPDAIKKNTLTHITSDEFKSRKIIIAILHSAPLKSHSKFWTHAPQKRHFDDFFGVFCVVYDIFQLWRYKP